MAPITAAGKVFRYKAGAGRTNLKMAPPPPSPFARKSRHPGGREPLFAAGSREIFLGARQAPTAPISTLSPPAPAHRQEEWTSQLPASAEALLDLDAAGGGGDDDEEAGAEDEGIDAAADRSRDLLPGGGGGGGGGVAGSAASLQLHAGRPGMPPLPPIRVVSCAFPRCPLKLRTADGMEGIRQEKNEREGEEVQRRRANKLGRWIGREGGRERKRARER